jgi:hypothetical protein
MLRLRVVKSLPPGHQDYFFEEVRKLASQYLRNKRVPSSDVVPEELVSEVASCLEQFLFRTSSHRQLS